MEISAGATGIGISIRKIRIQRKPMPRMGDAGNDAGNKMPDIQSLNPLLLMQLPMEIMDPIRTKASKLILFV